MENSRRWDLNPQPQLYESCALPLSYVGDLGCAVLRQMMRVSGPKINRCESESTNSARGITFFAPSPVIVRGHFGCVDSDGRLA